MYSDPERTGFGPRDRQRPHPGDPEAAFYGGDPAAGTRWVDADGMANPAAGTLPRTYTRPPRYVRSARPRRPLWLTALIVILALLLAVPLLKLALALLVVASVLVAMLVGLLIGGVMLALAVVVLVLVGRAVLGQRHARL
jgi:hypothetical protein